MKRVLFALLLVVLLAPPAVADPSGQGQITVTADAQSPERVVVAFDSAVLDRRVEVVAWLPQSWRSRGRQDPMPVVYHLPDTADASLAPAAELEAGYRDGELRVGQDFLAVFADAGDARWCGSCGWVDGRGGAGVAAETHLYEELLPVVESVFDTRRDRAGRGIVGVGAGGTAALVQGLRHPDRWGFVGALGASTPSETGLLVQSSVAAATSLRGQGFLPHDEVQLRNVDPLTLAPNLSGAGVETVVVTPAGGSPGTDEAAAAKLAELGVPLLRLTPPAGTEPAVAYRDILLHRLGRAFASAAEPPEVFSYKTVDRQFSMWGYDLSVARDNEEFLSLLGARLDGRRFVLAGTGEATLRTPPAFVAGSTHAVRVTVENGDQRTETVVADADGRLALQLDLAPTRTYDERLALLQSGSFLFPHTLVEVDPAVEPTDDSPAAAPDPAGLAAALPAPYDGWGVTLTPDPERRPGLQLEFTSPLLGRSVLNHVWLPNSYDHGGTPSPTLYWLHGTSSIECEPEPLGTLVSLTPVQNCQPGGGYYGWNTGFHNQLARQRAVVVVPDTRYPHWCGHCFWVDGRDGKGLAAESHLHQELLPLVEALLNVRQDRGGRALLGHSMGGSGALIQGFRHPDRFAFVGAVGASVPDEVVAAGVLFPLEWAGYLRDSGYDLTDEVAFRNIDPFTLSPQMAQQHVDTMVVIGDGCSERDDETCHALPEPMVRGGYSGDDEANYRTFGASASARMAQLGLPHHYLKRDGTHESHLADSYARLTVDRLNALFADPAPAPREFSYKTADRAFSVWDYHVSVERPNEEFLNLVAARADGTRFALAGTGVATVRTPATFQPGSSLDVLVTTADGSMQLHPMTTDGEGRLTLQVDLGAVREVDERLSLLESGGFAFPMTAVEVLEQPTGCDAADAQLMPPPCA